MKFNGKTVTANGAFVVTPYTDIIDDTRCAEDAIWSSKNTVDKLCPDIDASGAIVTCEPVAGYPLHVYAEPLSAATTITRCGKNLLNTAKANLKQVSWIEKSGVAAPTYYGVELFLPPGSYVMKAKPNGTTTVGYIYGHITDIDGNDLGAYSPVYGGTMNEMPTTFTDLRRVVIYEASASIESGKTSLETAYAWFSRFDIQLEVGSKATAFEPYIGETFALKTGVIRPNTIVPALQGINTLWADAGEITVTGKADPNAVIKKLTNDIAALGGNV
jgi:hypothetical protein